MSAALLVLLSFAASPPNIVFLLADDLGYGDLGCTGHPYARTPAIDRLAREGTRFTQFYVAGATCCPSRTGLMTGRFPARFAKYPATYGFGDAVTLPQLLQKAGYRTAHFGKWHMGDEQKPGTHGLEVVDVLGGNRRDPRGRDALITDRTIEFIRANKARPFYVNVWFHTPHAPVAPPESFRAPFAKLVTRAEDFTNPDMKAHLSLYAKLGGDVNAGMRAYLGDLAQLDSQVARILKALDDAGLRDNTLVVFTSDNGPAKCTGGNKDKKIKENMLGSAGPFHERKHSLFDGGIHTPLIVRWPGQVPAKRVEEKAVLAGVDFLPSVCKLVGVKPPAKIDGEDRSSAWLGKPTPRKGDLFWRASNPKDSPAMRREHWKAHLDYRSDRVSLYDLAQDPGERSDVAAKHPKIAREMGDALRKWVATLPREYEKSED